jgi:hypothetical protein
MYLAMSALAEPQIDPVNSILLQVPNETSCSEAATDTVLTPPIQSGFGGLGGGEWGKYCAPSTNHGEPEEASANQRIRSYELRLFKPRE